MAEFDHYLIKFNDGLGNAMQLIAICEDTQTELDLEGDPSPLVVGIRLVNTTVKNGYATWIQANGSYTEGTVLPGENHQINVAPPRRVPLYQLRYGASWS